MRPGNSKIKAVEDIAGLAVLLVKAGVDFGAEDVADALWLAGHMGDLPQREDSRSADQQRSTSANREVREEFVENEPDVAEGTGQLSLPTRQSQTSGGVTPESGIAIKVPAAPALRIRLELARALRPLRRSVPSPSRLEFDEAATVEQIADQQIWSPVLKPAPERWLDVALVVEDMQSLSLWEETIAEFQTLVERQGAFRRVTTWRLKAKGSHKLNLFRNWQQDPHNSYPVQFQQLHDPAGRRLILLLSDCTSSAWHDGLMLTWLQSHCQQAPTAVIQLLPQRLWSQTALAQGTSVWLRSLEPGVVSAKLLHQYRLPLLQQLLSIRKSQPAQRLTVPVVTLEAESLKQWAGMVASSGDSRAIGIEFDLQAAAASPHSSAASEARGHQDPSAAERVQRFWTTASLKAQKLAGLMSAAPVSPPIVNLIRQTLLPKAEPVHVAEVFMGGLMQAQSVPSSTHEKASSLQFDFAPGVRTLLSDTVSKTTTESVLDAVSRYISDRLGLSIKNFEALLQIDFQGDPEAEDMILPFAEIAVHTLERMGGEYAAVAGQLTTQPKAAPPPSAPDPNDLFPLLQTFTFREATLTSDTQAAAENVPETPLTDEIEQAIQDEIEQYGLTQREAEIWWLRRHDKTYAEIAAALYISVNTVKKQVKSIYAKRSYAKTKAAVREAAQRHGMTQGEMEVWELFQLEHSVVQIARELGMSCDAVEGHLRDIRLKQQRVDSFEEESGPLLGSDLGRYFYLHETSVTTKDLVDTYREQTRKLQRDSRHRFEFQCNAFMESHQRPEHEPIPNPTRLPTSEFVAAFQHYHPKRNNSYYQQAQSLLKENKRIKTMRDFQDEFSKYLIKTVSEHNPRYRNNHFGRSLHQQLLLAADSDMGVNQTMVVHVCRRALEFIVVKSLQRPNTVIFQALIKDVGYEGTIGLLLKIVLFCKPVRPWFEERFGILFHVYEQTRKEEIPWLVNALEHLNIALALNHSEIGAY